MEVQLEAEPSGVGNEIHPADRLLPRELVQPLAPLGRAGIHAVLAIRKLPVRVTTIAIEPQPCGAGKTAGGP